MLKGTTPRHTFTLPIDTGLIKSIQIIYAQNDNVKLIKETEQCTLSGNTAVVKLSQEDTLEFEEETCVQMQVRVLLHNGDALASGIMRTRCEGVLYDGVLV